MMSASYKCRGEIIPMITDRFRDTVFSPSTMAYYAMGASDYILKMYIISIDSALDKLAPSSDTSLARRKYIYRACAEVLDTIKGKRFVNYNGLITNNHSNKIQTSGPIVYFTYTARMYDFLYSAPLNGQSLLPNASVDTTFAFTETDGTITYNMKAGQTIVGFIRLEDRLIDSTRDYFEMMLDPLCSLMALPVKDGQILDVNHYWSTSNSMLYGDWRTIANTIKNAIVNKSY